MTVVDVAPDGLDDVPAGGRVPPIARKRLKGAMVGFGLFMWVMSGAMGGVKGATVAAVVSVLVAAGLAARPGIAQWLLVDSPTADVPPTRRSVFLVDLAERATGSRMREAVTAVVLLGLSVVLAIVAASIGEKALIILVGLVALLAMLAFIKNRTLFFMFVFAASFSLILYKKFTPILAESYAVAIYITTVDVVILFLYFIWASEGTLFRDLRSGLKNPVFMLPIAGLAVTLCRRSTRPTNAWCGPKWFAICGWPPCSSTSASACVVGNTFGRSCSVGWCFWGCRFWSAPPNGSPVGSSVSRSCS